MNSTGPADGYGWVNDPPMSAQPNADAPPAPPTTLVPPDPTDPNPTDPANPPDVVPVIPDLQSGDLYNAPGADFGSGDTLYSIHLSDFL
jgi:hypothetical protein